MEEQIMVILGIWVFLGFIGSLLAIQAFKKGVSVVPKSNLYLAMFGPIFGPITIIMVIIDKVKQMKLWQCKDCGENIGIVGRFLFPFLHKCDRKKIDWERNIFYDKKYQRSRRARNKYFRGKTKTIKQEEYDGYLLTIKSHETREGCWNYTSGVVTKGAKTIARIKRNYSSFVYTFVTHPNGMKYLICGEDYQGYTVINLTDEVIYNYIPKAWEKGFGFCWIEHTFDKETCELTVYGCVWACPFENRVYDFTDPSKMPYKLLRAEDAPLEDDDDDEEEDD